MTRKTWLVGAAAALLVAVPTAWYLGSPWWTLWRMREAARAGDMRTLASYVDLDAVQKALVVDARARIEEEAARLLAGDRTTAGAWAGALRGPWSRQALTGAETVKSLLNKGVPLRRRDLLGGPLGLNPLVQRRSFDEFAVRVGNVPSPGTFTFRRHGLGWKLEAVQLAGIARVGPPLPAQRNRPGEVAAPGQSPGRE